VIGPSRRRRAQNGTPSRSYEAQHAGTAMPSLRHGHLDYPQVREALAPVQLRETVVRVM
jgi:hypothetical protein